MLDWNATACIIVMQPFVFIFLNYEFSIKDIDMSSDTANLIIGNRIKELRKQNGLTQQELADRSELTKGFISQLERGQVSPSVTTLFDLIECLGTTPSEFFKEDTTDRVVYRASDYFEKEGEDGTSVQWIVPSAQSRQMEPILVTIPAYTKLNEDTPHHGEEFGYVFSGRIMIHRGERKYEAKAGESFYYPADKPHYIENQTGRPARFLWVSTPPSF